MLSTRDRWLVLWFVPDCESICETLKSIKTMYRVVCGFHHCWSRTRKHFPADTDPLAWWKSHVQELPLLGNVARFLCIPATSEPSERVSSSSGHKVSPHCSKLIPGKANMHSCIITWTKREMSMSPKKHIELQVWTHLSDCIYFYFMFWLSCCSLAENNQIIYVLKLLSCRFRFT